MKMQLENLGTAIKFLFDIGPWISGLTNDMIAASAATAGLSAEAINLLPALTALSTALPWIVGIGAAIGAIAIGVNEYKKAHPTLETLQKDADAAKQEFDEMQSKVDETKKRIDELNELKKSGDLSSAEQKELDNLESQNEQYERQLELLKEIAEYKQDKVTEKANSDAAKKLKDFTDNAWQGGGKNGWDLEGLYHHERNTSGLGGLLNAIDDYTVASKKLDDANKALSDAELDKADEKTLDALRDDISKAEKELNKHRETLATFQDFLVGLRGDLTDEGSIATVDSLLDNIATALGIKDSNNTFENFRKGLKQIGDDADEVVNKFIKDENLTVDQTNRLRQCLLDMGYSAEDVAVYFDRMAKDMAESSAKSTSTQIKNLTSLRDELATTSEALDAYKKALEGGEKGDAAAEMAQIYQSAMEAYKAGKVDTYAMRAAADLFFDRDFLAENNYGLDQIGELLSSGIWEAVFSSDDYASNFVNYMQENASEIGDAIKITTDAAGNIQFAYKSVSDLANATNMSEASVVALLDALDVMGVQAMMSGEDMGQLADKLSLIPGETVKSAEGIKQIIDSLATDEDMGFWDIQATLKSLESAGLIDTSGIQELGQLINEATQGLDDLGGKEESPTVDVADNATGTLERITSLLDGIDGRHVSASVGVSTWHSGGGSSGRGGSFAGGTTNAPRGKAYVNELGPETVIQDGVAKEFNDGKPALVDLKPGDVVLPADVTADAKRNGHKAKKFGSAYAGANIRFLTTLDGGGGKKRVIDIFHDATKKVVENFDKDKGGGGSGSGGSPSGSDQKQKIDWIEVAIDRIERTINKFKKTIDSTFKSLGKRLSTSKDAISEITKEIELQQKAADRYLKEAESVGLSDDLAKLVREGTVDITEYDEETAKLINEYKQWYEKSLDCASAVDDLHESLGDLYRGNFDAVQEDFENKISQIEHEAKMLNTEMDKLEASGYLRSAKAYSSLANIESKNLSMLKSELAELQKYFEQAMKSGEIEEGSKSWYEMRSEIDGVKEAISESELQLIEFAKTIREINWENFDYSIGRISRLTEESEFLIGLLEDSKLFNDDGSFTDEGITSVGLRLQNYNTYMAQADQYAEELKRIEGELQKDPWNKDLIARREQLLDLQQQSITEANNEKRAAADLAKQGIEKQVEAMRDLIDAYTKSLDSAKDLYDYQKKVSKQTSTIADIQKQLAAYTNDSSEENRSRVQKLQKQLKEAEESLQETEYEHYISEQKKLMEDLYSDYEETVNSRLDDIDALIDDLIGATNASSDAICQTIERISAGVGYAPTDEMRSVWDGSNGTFSIVSKYGGSIDTKLTSVGQAISAILANVQAMVAASGISVKQYKTGGLIDYTGIAKVDGTPSKPELVLDSSDTKNLLTAINSVRGVNWAGISTTPTLSALRDMSRMFGRVNSGINQRALSGGIDNVEVNISIKRVDDYNDFIAQLQRDKNAERIIKALAEDAIFGGNSMGKYKVNVRN